jgi:predicted nucleic acid-binding protein
MNRFVLDCSITLSWFFEDEQTEDSDRVRQAIELGSEIVVPSIWPLEIINGLVVAERRKRITNYQLNGYIERIRLLPIHIDTIQLDRTLTDVLKLAEKHALSSYDASYLELSVRNSLPIATLDRKLRSAAENLEIAIFGST